LFMVSGHAPKEGYLKFSQLSSDLFYITLTCLTCIFLAELVLRRLHMLMQAKMCDLFALCLMLLTWVYAVHKLYLVNKEHGFTIGQSFGTMPSLVHRSYVLLWIAACSNYILAHIWLTGFYKCLSCCRKSNPHGNLIKQQTDFMTQIRPQHSYIILGWLLILMPLTTASAAANYDWLSKDISTYSEADTHTLTVLLFVSAMLQLLKMIVKPTSYD